MMYLLLQQGRVSNPEQQATGMGVDAQLAKWISQRTWQRAEHRIKRIIRKRHSALRQDLRYSCRQYQRSWDQINSKFFRTVEHITDQPWEYSRYICVVSAFHRGISNWNGNIIGRVWSEHPLTMRRFTAHELIITHIFSIFRNNPKYCGRLPERGIWALAEICGWCMTGLEPALLSLWPWLTSFERFSTHHNYQFLVPLQEKLKVLYLQKKSFHTFMSHAVILTSSYPLKKGGKNKQGA